MFFIFLEKVSFLNRCSICWQTSYSYLNPVLLYLSRSWALLIGPSLVQCWPPFDSSSLRSVLFTRWVGGTSIVTTFNFFSLLRKHLSCTPTLCWWHRRPVFDSTRKKKLFQLTILKWICIIAQRIPNTLWYALKCLTNERPLKKV